MKNAVIITAKGSNTSVQNKNIIPILGIPVLLYVIRAAQLAPNVHKIYVSTEDQHIKALAVKNSLEVIDRPPELATPTAHHADAIEHAVRHVQEQIPEVENFVVLLGNTVMITPGLITKSFQMLEEEDCDSVCSVWKAQDDHPYRAMKVNDEGYMESFLAVDCGSNRQSYPPVYFYDQGIWGFKGRCALEREGPVPWLWLGKKCKVIERPWVTGRDIHSWIDVSASAWYLTSIQAVDFMDYTEI